MQIKKTFTYYTNYCKHIYSLILFFNMNYLLIKQIAEQKEITFKSLCAKIGVTEAGLHQMIRNESMRIDVLEKISNAFSVPVSTFFGDGQGEQSGNINSTIISANHGKINYQAETESLKKEINQLKKDNLLYWELTESLVDNMTEVYVQIIEQSPEMNNFLAELKQTKRFIGQINTLEKLTDHRVLYSKKFFEYFENPYY